MEFDEKTIVFIAIGASAACNCQACLEFNVSRARESGAGETEIADAIKIGQRVRSGAAMVMDRFIREFQEAAGIAGDFTRTNCGCSEPIKE